MLNKQICDRVYHKMWRIFKNVKELNIQKIGIIFPRIYTSSSMIYHYSKTFSYSFNKYIYDTNGFMMQS